MFPRFLLIHPEWGIYLGAFIGMGFWSKLESAGQTLAVVFASSEEALQFAGKTFPGEWQKMTITPILIHESFHASLDEIVGAGLEGWNPLEEGPG